ncbi:MAG: peptidoglycan editing factor PgeF [Burkholderiaceae bacterium]
MNEHWIRPDWPAPPNVGSLITTRAGGVSRGPYGARPNLGGGMNIGLSCGDAFADVVANRTLLRALLPAEPRWLNQVHGAAVVDAAEVSPDCAADASFTDAPSVVCAVAIADCMPVLLADSSGRCVGIAHAGWRGLAAGVIQAAARAIRERLGDDHAELLAYLGPAIGPRHFEVGAEVLYAMQVQLPDASNAFVADADKYRADLFALGRQALRQVGVDRIYGGHDCTFSDATRFYSFRRQRPTGRHAALIWRV